ncbi:CopG family transcriptional regulator [Streptomyces sp. NPDC059247]|uniref:CopG family transcriptional regulator n=1 Tax=Streptomyces sp. NPDC059247 TaxID=3346790 RepID=UPI003683F624
MALNPRFHDDRTEVPEPRAEQEGASTDALAPHAVDDRLARTAREAIVRGAAMEQAAKWHELMERLK